MRVPGDTIFSVGALLLAWFVARHWVAPDARGGAGRLAAARDAASVRRVSAARARSAARRARLGRSRRRCSPRRRTGCCSSSARPTCCWRWSGGRCGWSMRGGTRCGLPQPRDSRRLAARDRDAVPGAAAVHLRLPADGVSALDEPAAAVALALRAGGRRPARRPGADARGTASVAPALLHAGVLVTHRRLDCSASRFLLRLLWRDARQDLARASRAPSRSASASSGLRCVRRVPARPRRAPRCSSRSSSAPSACCCRSSSRSRTGCSRSSSAASSPVTRAGARCRGSAAFWVLALVASRPGARATAMRGCGCRTPPLAVLTATWLWRNWPRGDDAAAAARAVLRATRGCRSAMALYAAQSAWFAATGDFVLGRAPAHALFIGFFGSLLVAMVTRVTQGHSGRPLVLGRVAAFAFVAIQVRRGAAHRGGAAADASRAAGARRGAAGCSRSCRGRCARRAST